MDPNFERENMAKGIARLIYLIVFIIALIIVAGFFFSCNPKIQAILPEGKVVGRDGDRYLVLWPDHGDRPHAFNYQWVYQPGLGWLDIEELEAFILIQPKSKKP